MQIKNIEDKNIWESFLKGCQEKTFVQSWNWGEFLKKEEEKIWRLGIYEEQELIAVCLAVKVKARRGTFLFVPHGPIVSPKLSEVVGILTEKLKEIGKTEKAGFIRMAPIFNRNDENNAIFEELGFLEAPIHMHPEVTWELDITKSEEELMSGMRKTTRYLARQAQKNSDVEIVKSRDINHISEFNNLAQETAKRHHFFYFSLDYLKKQFLSFLPDDQILIFLAKYKGEIISSAIIVFWQDRAFYHHGASLVKYQKIPASYLIQWEAIKEAKQRGCKIYNFWGIAPDIDGKEDLEKSSHPWAGLTLFKMGFGGYKKNYVKTQDLPLSFNYYLTRIFEKIRKSKRRL